DIDEQTFLVTANEGDDREYGDFEEAVRVKDLDLDPDAFDDVEALESPECVEASEGISLGG
ncbi:MAG: alkaline phosphatase, partial [Nannocystaceae bacterium]